MSGTVLWFTGLSGSGKTTIANKLAGKLEQEGKTVKILDGDMIRDSIHRHLGFTPNDIKENNNLITKLCLKYKNKYNFVFVPIISPFAESRAKAKKLIGESFIEIYIRASLEEVIRRDVKGLYKKAINGEIENFVGISSSVPYESPGEPDVYVDTEIRTADGSTGLLYNYLREKGLLAGGETC